MEVSAGAAVTRVSLLQGAVMSSSPRPHRSGSASSEACFVLFGICLVLPYTYPGTVPWFAFGILPSRVVTSPSLTGANSATVDTTCIGQLERDGR